MVADVSRSCKQQNSAQAVIETPMHKNANVKIPEGDNDKVSRGFFATSSHLCFRYLHDNAA
jgi:hypothetical protein